MKKLHALCICFALMLATVNQSWAQLPPIIGIETINELVVPGPPIVRVFPNIFDPFHEKLLRFQGGYESTITPDVNLLVQFDWLDPQNPTVPGLSDPFPFPLDGGGEIDVSWRVPFCPPLVSLDLSLDVTTPNAVAFVGGTFTHECLIDRVPETLTGYEWLALMALLIGGAMQRARGRKTSAC